MDVSRTHPSRSRRLVANRWRFSGKEDLSVALGDPVLDFGARMYSSTGAIWQTQDPMAEKYYDISPYSYCAGDPVILVDPDGRTWENVKQVERLKKRVDTRISYHNKETEKLESIIAKGKLNGSRLDRAKERISTLTKMKEHLRTSLSDIELLGNDTMHLYSLRNLYDSSQPNYVKRIDDVKIEIQGLSDALFLHEIAHVRQALDKGVVKFNAEGLLCNPGYWMNDFRDKRIKAGRNDELEAYRIQYSMDEQSMPYMFNGGYSSITGRNLLLNPSYNFLNGYWDEE